MESAPSGWVKPVSYEGFLIGGTYVCVLLDGALSLSLKGSAMFSSVFGGVCRFGMALVSLSANV